MHPLQNGSQSVERPPKKPLVGTPGWFTESGNDNLPSYPGADWFNHVIAEFANALASRSVTFDPDSDNNLAELFSSLSDEYVSYQDVEENQFPVISSEGSVVWQDLSKLVTNIHPSLNENNSPKLVLFQTDGSYQVLTKKGKLSPGYVMMTMQKTTQPPDDFNEFGSSHTRPTTVYEISDAIVGRLQHSDSSVSKGTALSSEFKAAVLGISSLSTIDFSVYPSGGPTFNSFDGFNLAAAGDYVEYTVSGNFSILFARTPGSSKSVVIEEKQSNGTYVQLANISLGFDNGNDGRNAAYKFIGNTSKHNLSSIRIRTEQSGGCYVFGVNINLLSEVDNNSITLDTAAYIRDTSFSYVENLGANDFAFRPGGKWFGSYHGGHEAESLMRYIDKGSFELPVPGSFELTKRVRFRSSSELHSNGIYEFNVLSDVEFFDGGYINHVSISPATGRNGVLCRDVYTSMNCSSPMFTQVEFPIYKTLPVAIGSRVPFGNTNHLIQRYPDKDYRIAVFSTLFHTFSNAYNGVRIDVQNAYNKFYYGPIVPDATTQPKGTLTDLSFVTAKIFY
ncbi:hypothetical protein BJL83_07350 [Vibrio parahaemolyticus]|nr:hypothetical protein BJL83_07350 [Vibrio parahaemolyticus]